MILDRIKDTTGFDMTNGLIRGAVAGCEYCQEIREVQAAALGVLQPWAEMGMHDKRGHHQVSLEQFSAV
jgi:hypothetical protein